MKPQIALWLIILSQILSFDGFCTNSAVNIKPIIEIENIKKDSLITDTTKTKATIDTKTKKPFFNEKEYEIMAMVSGILAICAFLGIVIFILSLTNIYIAASPIFILSTPINLLLAIILGKISKRKIKNKKWAKLGIILGIFDLIFTTLIGSLLIYIAFNWGE